MIKEIKNAILACLLVLTSANLCSAQYGVNIMYKRPNSNEAWNQVLSDPLANNLLPNTIGLSVDYWFRLKKYRIEFLPEVSYFTGKNEGISFNDGQTGQVKWREFAFSLNTNIYLFDLLGDCNCPTFDKQNTLFKKGFYFQISPGISFAQGSINASVNNATKNNLLPTLSIGTGLDIGLSKFITITPWLRYYTLINANWIGLEVYQNTPGALHEMFKTNISGFLFGLRMGYRMDYKKRY